MDQVTKDELNTLCQAASKNPNSLVCKILLHRKKDLRDDIRDDIVKNLTHAMKNGTKCDLRSLEMVLEEFAHD